MKPGSGLSNRLLASLCAGTALLVGGAASSDPPLSPLPDVRFENYWVTYFAPNQDRLTSEGQEVVAAAAQYAVDVHVNRIRVVGHADTADDNAIELSKRRARNTVDVLIRNGVDPKIVVIAWSGAADLAVPTPDKTAEPQNRRASIQLSFLPQP